MRRRRGDSARHRGDSARRRGDSARQRRFDSRRVFRPAELRSNLNELRLEFLASQTELRGVRARDVREALRLRLATVQDLASATELGGFLFESRSRRRRRRELLDESLSLRLVLDNLGRPPRFPGLVDKHAPVLEGYREREAFPTRRHLGDGASLTGHLAGVSPPRGESPGDGLVPPPVHEPGELGEPELLGELILPGLRVRVRVAKRPRQLRLVRGGGGEPLHRFPLRDLQRGNLLPQLGGFRLSESFESRGFAHGVVRDRPLPLELLEHGLLRGVRAEASLLDLRGGVLGEFLVRRRRFLRVSRLRLELSELSHELLRLDANGVGVLLGALELLLASCVDRRPRPLYPPVERHRYLQSPPPGGDLLENPPVASNFADVVPPRDKRVRRRLVPPPVHQPRHLRRLDLLREPFLARLGSRFDPLELRGRVVKLGRRVADGELQRRRILLGGGEFATELSLALRRGRLGPLELSRGFLEVRGGVSHRLLERRGVLLRGFELVGEVPYVVLASLVLRCSSPVALLLLRFELRDPRRRRGDVDGGALQRSLRVRRAGFELAHLGDEPLRLGPKLASLALGRAGASLRLLLFEPTPLLHD